MRKTFKREVAVAQLVLHWALVVFVCYLAIQDSTSLDAMIGLATGLAVWVYGYAAAAFGMDSWAKQIKEQPQEELFDE